MRLDFLTCGSASDGFFGCIAFARRSLDALGGIYKGARLVAAFGDYDRPEIPDRWAEAFENVEVIWANPDGRPNPWHILQHEARLGALRDDADVAVIVDFDVCLMRPFDDLLAEIRRDGSVAGVMAHYHFPLGEERGDPAADWSRIARAVLGRDIDRPFRYLYGRDPAEGPILEPAARPAAPFYINYGVVMGPPARLREMIEAERALCPAVSAITGPRWAPQITLPLACAERGLPVRALPPRYNYCNRPETDLLYPGETGRIVFFHYMFERHFKRLALFHKPHWFDRFLAAPAAGADEHLRQHILALTGGRFPYPRTAAERRAAR